MEIVYEEEISIAPADGWLARIEGYPLKSERYTEKISMALERR